MLILLHYTPTYIIHHSNVFLLIDVMFITAPPPPTVQFGNVFLLIYVNFITAPPPPTVFSVGMYFF